MSKHMSPEVMAELTDYPTVVGRIIQQTFFPPPPTHWEGLSPNQKEEFRDCAKEIMNKLIRRGWHPPKGMDTSWVE